MAVPPAKISQLSSGEFAGVVGDTPDDPVKLKAFHGYIDQDNKKLGTLQAGFSELPSIRKVTNVELKAHCGGIRKDVVMLVQTELKRMRRTPGLSELILEKFN